MNLENPNIIIEGFGVIALLLSLIGAVLNVKKNIFCFHIWILSNVFLITINVIQHSYSEITLWVIYTIINIYGIFEWRKKNKQV